MFKIYDGRTHFWQWDTDCKLVVEDSSIQQVHFCNRLSEYSFVCLTYKENEQLLVNVPNILFQSDRDIHVYAYNGYTKYEACFKVFARSKPANYVYTETEVLNYNTLLQKINQVDENIGVAVEDYLIKHPVEPGATEEQAAQIEANKQAISDIQNAGYITTVPDEYITETELNSRGFLTSIPAEYVTDTELNAKGYATTDDVATAVSDKVTMEDVHNATSGFVSQAYVDEKIAAIPEPDLSGYALKSEIPDMSAFQTEAQVNALINSALGVIENGTY